MLSVLAVGKRYSEGKRRGVRWSGLVTLGDQHHTRKLLFHIYRVRTQHRSFFDTDGCNLAGTRLSVIKSTAYILFHNVKLYGNWYQCHRIYCLPQYFEKGPFLQFLCGVGVSTPLTDRFLNAEFKICVYARKKHFTRRSKYFSVKCFSVPFRSHHLVL